MVIDAYKGLFSMLPEELSLGSPLSCARGRLESPPAPSALSRHESSPSFLEIQLSSPFRPEGGGPFRRPAK